MHITRSVLATLLHHRLQSFVASILGHVRLAADAGQVFKDAENDATFFIFEFRTAEHARRGAVTFQRQFRLANVLEVGSEVVENLRPLNESRGELGGTAQDGDHVAVARRERRVLCDVPIRLVFLLCRIFVAYGFSQLAHSQRQAVGVLRVPQIGQSEQSAGRVVVTTIVFQLREIQIRRCKSRCDL